MTIIMKKGRFLLQKSFYHRRKMRRENDEENEENGRVCDGDELDAGAGNDNCLR